MTQRDQKRRSGGPAVLLLLLLMGAGGGNYYRNLEAESANKEARPYAGYSVDDLESLRDAYASELSGVRARFESAKRNRARPAGDLGSIAGNIEQFQRAKRAGSAIRAAAASVVEREGQINALERELALRTFLGHGLSRHLRRFTTI